MSTQRLPQPGDRRPVMLPPPTEQDTRALGPLQNYTKRRYMLTHAIFTLRLIWRCLADPYVAPGNKLLFVGIIGVLLGALLLPETAFDILSLVAPILDFFNIPVEGLVDWGSFVVIAGSLMGLFPQEVVRRHIIELRGGGSNPPVVY
ncbi:MAG: hypothetical protein ACR2M0_11255 [Chloroflexia bacterium]